MSYDDFDRLTSGDVENKDIEIQTGFAASTYGALAEVFYPLYKFLFGGRDWPKRFETKLDAANINTTAGLWLSGAFAIGFIIGGLTVLSIFALAILGFLPVFTPTIELNFLPRPDYAATFVTAFGVFLGIMGYAALGAIVGLIVGGGIATIIPYLKARRRSREIQLVQPDAISFMHAQAVSGRSQMEIIRSVAEAEDQYGEFSVEFQRIISEIEVFNRDFNTAVSNIANTTPNEDLQKFLTGMLSTLGAGGDIVTHLENAKDREQQNRERQLESIVDKIRLIGQAYTTLMLLPMLLVIILMIMAIIGDPRVTMLLLVVYGIQPMINLVYGLGVSSIKIDQVGDGYLRAEDGSIPGRIGSSPFEFQTTKEYLDQAPGFEQIYQKEAESKLTEYLINDPWSFFTEYPKYIFFITVPLTIVGWVVMWSLGLFTPRWSYITEEPLLQTVILAYWPLFTNLVPFVIFHEIRERKRGDIMASLAEDFRSLAEHNENIGSLPGALKEVSKTSSSTLSDEFGTMYKKLQIGVPMSYSLKELNNKYANPELARQFKILEQAQEVSSEISDVLTTAAETAEYKESIKKTREAKMNTQLIIIEAAFFVFLVIMAGMDIALLEFASSIIEDGESIIGSDTDVNNSALEMIFIHAAFIQGFCAGLLAGYVKASDIGDGVKLALFNTSLVLVVWLALPYVTPLLEGYL